MRGGLGRSLPVVIRRFLPFRAEHGQLPHIWDTDSYDGSLIFEVFIATKLALSSTRLRLQSQVSIEASMILLQ